MNLDLKKNGKPEPSLANLETLILHHYNPRYDTHTKRIILSVPLPSETVDFEIVLFLCKQYSVKFSSLAVRRMLGLLAMRNQFGSTNAPYLIKKCISIVGKSYHDHYSVVEQLRC